MSIVTPETTETYQERETNIESDDDNEGHCGLRSTFPEHRRLQKIVAKFEAKFVAANDMHYFLNQYLEEHKYGMIYRLLPDAIGLISSRYLKGEAYPIQFCGFPTGAGTLGNGSTIPFQRVYFTSQINHREIELGVVYP